MLELLLQIYWVKIPQNDHILTKAKYIYSALYNFKCQFKILHPKKPNV